MWKDFARYGVAICRRYGLLKRALKRFIDPIEIGLTVYRAPIEHSRLRGRLGRTPMSTLHAICDSELSKSCSVAFSEIIVECAARLPALTFHLLRDRVLRGGHA